MPPKKGNKGKKGKKKGPPEPAHDSGWEKALSCGKWARPVEALPDPNAYPTFGELREKILSALEELSIHWSASLTNYFSEEVFSSLRPNLRRIDFRGANNLSKIVISPSTMLPNLQVMDLSCCKSLEYLLIQCDSLETLSVHRCIALKKVILYTSSLKDTNFHECKEISTLILWSDKLSNLDLHSPKLALLQLFCPNLVKFKEPHLKPTTPPVNHPTINTILEVDLERKKNEELEKDVRLLNDVDYKPYSSSPILPQSCFLGY